MSDYDHGPIQTYEITWASGHVETVRAHQVTLPPPSGGVFSMLDTKTDRIRTISFHGEIDGHWRLVLSVREEDVRSIRNVTHSEPIPGGDPS